MKSATSHVGKRVSRREDRPLVLGESCFLPDIESDGMLHVQFFRSRHAHAEILEIHTLEAESMPGVEDIVTYEDLRDDVTPMPWMFSKTEEDFGIESALATVLADGKVRFVGEPICAVLAEDPYQARDALESIHVKYSPLEAVLDARQALGDQAALLYEEYGTNRIHHLSYQTGEPHDSMEAADHVIQEDFTCHRVSHVPLEGRGVVVDPESGGERSIRVHLSSQAAHTVKNLLSKILSISPDRLDVISPDVGGAFGQKSSLYPEEVVCTWLAQNHHQPVKWIETRRENFQGSGHGREQRARLKLGVDDDGTFRALEATIHTDHGAQLNMKTSVPSIVAADMLRGPYRISNYSVEAHTCFTNKTPLTPYRGVGAAQATFYMERMVEIAAHELHMDSRTLRRKNLHRREEFPIDKNIDSFFGHIEYDSGDYIRCLNRAIDSVDMADVMAQQPEKRRKRSAYGVGLACYVELSSGGYEEALLELDEGGQFNFYTGTAEFGQGLETTFAQLLADELQLSDMDRINVIHDDTRRVPTGMGSWSSRSVAIGGTAGGIASRKLKQTIVKRVADRWECRTEDVVWNDGMMHLEGIPSQSITLEELVEGEGRIRASHRHEGLNYPNGVHVGVIEIDLETGQLRVPQYVVVHDCGTIINPTLLEGQISGGVVQGLGTILHENLQYDSKGQLKNGSLMDYALPRADILENLQIKHVETPSPTNVYGTKGAGEGGTIPVASVIVNGIEDALGPFDRPLTDDGPYQSERIMELMTKKS